VSNASLTSSPAHTDSPVLESPPPTLSTNQQQSSTSRSKSWSGRPLWMEKEYACRIKVPHTLVVHNYTRPTVCQLCKKLLKGLFRQGLQCKGRLPATLSLSFPARGTGHHPSPLQEAPQASWIALVVEVGPQQLLPSLVIRWALLGQMFCHFKSTSYSWQALSCCQMDVH